MKKITTLLLTAALIVSPFNSLKGNAETDNITVKISYFLNNKTEIPFSVNGAYATSTGDSFTQGVSYKVKVNGTSFDLYENGVFVKKLSSPIILTPKEYNYSHFVSYDQKNYLGTTKFQIENGIIRPYNTLVFEDYLKGVVSREMSNGWGSYGGIEALKSQAVAARTFAFRYKSSSYVTDTDSHQVYGGYSANNSYSNTAVDQTRNEILTYNNQPIGAYYSSTNGGQVLSVTNSWGSNFDSYPYLTKKYDPFSISANQHLNWSFSIHKRQIDLSTFDLSNPSSWWNSASEIDSSIMNAIKSRITPSGSEIKIVGMKNLDFVTEPYSKTDLLTGSFTVQYIERKGSVYTMENGKIKVLEKTVSNRTDNLRPYFGTQGNYQNLRSPNVTSVSADSSKFTVVGSGWGHGIGMSQWGAYQMSKQGYNYRDILGFYYPGTSIYNGSTYAALKNLDIPEPLWVKNVSTSVSTDNLNTFTLSFDTNKSANINVDLKDMTGKVVSVIKPRVWESAGHKILTWNGGTLNGNYTYELRVADSQSVITKTGEAAFNYLKPGLSYASIQKKTSDKVGISYELSDILNVLIEIQTLDGERVALLEEYINQVPGKYDLNYQNTLLHGEYIFNVIASDEKGSENIQEKIALSVPKPAYSDKMQTVYLLKNASVFSDKSNTEKIGSLSKGESVQVFSKSSNQYEVAYHGVKAFVPESAITISNSKDIRVSVDGFLLSLEDKPSLASGTTLIPINGIQNGLGFKITKWDNKKKEATLVKGGTTIVLKIGSRYAYFNGKKVELNRAPSIINSRTYVPLRFVAQATNSNVAWDSDYRMIWIKK